MHMGSNHGITNTLFWYPSDNLVKTYFQQLLFSIFWDFPTQRKNFILVQKITLLQRGNPRWPLIAKMFLGNKLYQRLLDVFSACHPLDSQVGIQLCQDLIWWQIWRLVVLWLSFSSGDEPSECQWAVVDHQSREGRWRWKQFRFFFFLDW